MVHAQHPSEPARLYSWTVVIPARTSSTVGDVGVTDDLNRAVGHVCDALRKAPLGARGLVHRVMLSFSGLGYVYEALVARGRVEPDSDTIVWDIIPAPPQDPWDPSESSQQLTRRQTDDALPPEAMDPQAEADGISHLAAYNGAGDYGHQMFTGEVLIERPDRALMACHGMIAGAGVRCFGSPYRSTWEAWGHDPQFAISEENRR
ncbi:MAG TPA: hypothetical protein VGP70_14360 [Actinomadura sp.]|nr:hypothetical protein [Actinomadura sp.]